jgi:hypothetical protein
MARSWPSRRCKRGQSALKALLWTLFLPLIVPGATSVRAQQAPASPSTSSSAQSSAPPVSPSLPRGKKLVLKDGSFQLVREYKVEGDRVRYYSLDSSSWEQMPADLVDWDATKKAQAEEAQRDSALVEKVRTQEAARVIQPLDIDASLEVAPGVFLPPGENLFVFDGKSVLPLPQAETSSKISKGRLLEQVMVPIPIVPSRQNVSIQGARAKFRLGSSKPEFYIRTANAREPHLELIRAKPHGDSRLIEHLEELFGERQEFRDALPMQKWEVARGVYRFTLGQPLAPGEYALAEVLDEEGMSLYVWDFGVDATASAAAQKAR